MSGFFWLWPFLILLVTAKIPSCLEEKSFIAFFLITNIVSGFYSKAFSPKSTCQLRCFSSTLCAPNLFIFHCLVFHSLCLLLTRMCLCPNMTLPCFIFAQSHTRDTSAVIVTFWSVQMPCSWPKCQSVGKKEHKSEYSQCIFLVFASGLWGVFAWPLCCQHYEFHINLFANFDLI